MTGRLLIAVTWVLGHLTPLAWLWLIWPRLGPTPTVHSGGDHAIAIDLAVALLFPLQHSVWTQARVKRRLTAWLGPWLERPAYVIASGLALGVTVLLWAPSGIVVWRLGDGALWPMRILFVATVVLQTRDAVVLGAARLGGTAHLKAWVRREPPPGPRFATGGLYRWVRHPTAALQITQLWLTPTLHADRLVMASIWTGWILLATLLEDRRLDDVFGEEYTAYRRRAGFLWPRWPRGPAARRRAG